MIFKKWANTYLSILLWNINIRPITERTGNAIVGNSGIGVPVYVSYSKSSYALQPSLRITYAIFELFTSRLLFDPEL